MFELTTLSRKCFVATCALSMLMSSGCGSKDAKKSAPAETPTALMNQIIQELHYINGAADLPAAKPRLEQLAKRAQELMMQDRSMDLLPHDEQLKMAQQRMKDYTGFLSGVGAEVQRIEQHTNAKTVDEVLAMVQVTRAQLEQQIPDAFSPQMAEMLRGGIEQNDLAKTQGHLRAIAQACVVYADQHAGNFPPDLQTLVLKTDPPMSAEAFRSPRSNTRLPENFAAFTKEQTAEWTAKNSDYVYLGGGKTMSAVGSAILCCENPEQISADVAMIHMDGNVDVHPAAQARELIAGQK